MFDDINFGAITATLAMGSTGGRLEFKSIIVKHFLFLELQLTLLLLEFLGGISELVVTDSGVQ